MLLFSRNVPLFSTPGGRACTEMTDDMPCFVFVSLRFFFFLYIYYYISLHMQFANVFCSEFIFEAVTGRGVGGEGSSLLRPLKKNAQTPKRRQNIQYTVIRSSSGNEQLPQNKCDLWSSVYNEQ